MVGAGARGRAYVGLSGWTYPAWRHGFYKGVPQRRWLEHCVRHFGSLEVNATFYRLLKPTTFARWREVTPPGFVFAAKGHRRVTHLGRLADPAEGIARQKENLAPLGDRLGAMLWQLPASLRRDLGRLEGFVEALAAWPEVRHAVEFRHESWFDDEVADLLDERGIAVCRSDAPRWPLWDRTTGGFAYVRLHGHERIYAGAYDDAALDRWARRIEGWLADGIDAYVYFDNDMEGAAPENALGLIARLGCGGPPAAEGPPAAGRSGVADAAPGGTRCCAG